jgi:hypothetical protein
MFALAVSQILTKPVVIARYKGCFSSGNPNPWSIFDESTRFVSCGNFADVFQKPFSLVNRVAEMGPSG